MVLFATDRIKNQQEILALSLAILSELIFVELLFKNLIGRVRPEYFFSQTIRVLGPSYTYSFPSGHAAVAFACTFILSRNRKKWTPLFILLAVLIAFSRIYLGKHYPVDVLVGAITGFIIGALSFRISGRLKMKEHF